MTLRVGLARPNSLPLHSGISIAAKQSAGGDFSSHMRQAMRSGAQVASDTARVASSHVPGAAMMSNVLSAAAADLGSDSAAGAGFPGVSGIADASGSVGASMPLSGGSVAAGGTGSISAGSKMDLQQSAAQIQRDMVASNMLLLKLQNEVQNKSQHFMAVSNMIKSKGDAEKSAIANMR
jgi:hypothetical protein